MKKYLQEYVSDFEKELNIPLMNKEADRPLVEYIIESWKSLEIVPNIKILKWEYTTNEHEIDINDFIFKREKKKKKKDRVNYKFINDDRFGALRVWIEITTEELDSDKILRVKKKVIKKDLLIPLQDEDGCFIIKGKKNFLIYQLVEKSTYTTSQCVTLKSLMPIAVQRNVLSARDINDTEYQLPVYYIYVFKKETPILSFCATDGLTYALQYLGVHNVIDIVDSCRDKEHNLYFQISSKVFVEVNKIVFNEHQYVRSIVGGLLTITTNRFTLDLVDDKEYWIKKQGNNNYDKGKHMLVFFNRLLDETTKRILKLDDYNKDGIYPLLRWIMMNFNELRQKDNLNLENKRLRCNEYIASLLTNEFSKRLNRVISLGAKANMDNFKDIFKFPGDIILQKMHTSGILRYDDTINDMDFFSKFRFTQKGPHSQGGKNSNNISMRTRGIHPSFLGYIDVLVCGNSDQLVRLCSNA